jgi:hypothetical protein
MAKDPFKTSLLRKGLSENKERANFLYNKAFVSGLSEELFTEYMNIETNEFRKQRVIDHRAAMEDARKAGSRPSYEWDSKRYKIMRFYHDHDKRPRAVPGMSGLTLAQAQAHCSNPKTQKEGEYFDGYTEEK